MLTRRAALAVLGLGLVGHPAVRAGGRPVRVRADAGFTDAHHLGGGLGAWQAAGGQVVA